MSATRIRVLFLVLAGGTVLVAFALFRSMVVDHDWWVERSYRNRWAFRDVPSRRGSILDRDGVVLRHDVPAVDLELRYREFRRGHAVGIALHGGNLLRRLEGRPADLRFDRPRGLAAAAGELLDVRLEWFASRPLRDEAARDLAFYAGTLIAALSGERGGAIRVELSRAVAERAAGTVLAPLAARLDEDLAPLRARLLDAFELRLAELLELDGRLVLLEADSDLLGFLERRRAAHAEWEEFAAQPERHRELLRERAFWVELRRRGIDSWHAWLALPAGRREALAAEFEPPDAPVADERPRLPWDESRPYPVRRQLPYRLAAWFGLIAGRHPGFDVRPNVRREPGPELAVDDLPGFAPLLGWVGAYQRADGAGMAAREAARVFDEVVAGDFFEDRTTGLPDELAVTLRQDARASLRNHFRSHGRLGREGVERACHAELSGDPGLRWIERGRSRREERMFESLDVAPGRDVVLTIDVDLQRIIEAVTFDLGTGEDEAYEQSIVVLDPRTGDVLAIASRTRGGDGQPVWSHAATFPNGTAFVGSVFKPLVLLEHLDAERHGRPHASPAAFRPCDGRYDVLRKLRCELHGDAALDPVTALGWSCNFFFFEAARGLTATGVERAARRFGWHRPAAGAAFAAGAYQEAVAGLTAARHFGPRFGEGTVDLEKRAIGYQVDASALHVARAYAALATGTLPTVTLVRGAPALPVRLDVDPADLAVVRAGLAFCVERGTGRHTTLHRYGVRGKTGTAEVTAAGHNNAWFAGFVGLDERATLAFAAVAYRVPHGSHGGDRAASMVEAVLGAIHDDPELRARYLPASGD